MSEPFHLVELRARVGGAETDLPVAQTQVEIGCPPSLPSGPVTDRPGITDNEGCAASGGPPSFGGFALLGFTMLVLRRRARR